MIADDTIEMTTSTIGRDLMQLFVQHMKALPKPWQKMSRDEQDETIDALRSGVRSAVDLAVKLIAADGKTIVDGRLDAVTIKRGIQCSISIPKGAPNLLNLYSSQGLDVVLVVADSAQHNSLVDSVKGEEDQRGLDLGHEYHENDGAGMPAKGTPNDSSHSDSIEEETYSEAVRLVTTHQRCSISWLQKELGVGYNRAARMLDQMESQGIVSAQHQAGVRSVLKTYLATH